MHTFHGAWVIDFDIRQNVMIQQLKQKQDRTMSTVIDEDLKAKMKKLNAQATALKMDLHDLAEDLPTGWERILEVSEKTYQAYLELNEIRKQIAESGS